MIAHASFCFFARSLESSWFEHNPMIFQKSLPCESKIKPIKFNNLALATLHFRRGTSFACAGSPNFANTRLFVILLTQIVRLMMDPVHIPASHEAGYPVAFSRRWLEKWHRRSGGRCPMTGAALDLKERSCGECPAG